MCDPVLVGLLLVIAGRLVLMFVLARRRRAEIPENEWRADA